MLKETIKSLPKTAGVYQFFDKDRKLLYIGKAKNLNARVKNYFKLTPKVAPSSNLSPRIHKMIEQTSQIEYIKVDSEHDAFILENSLIKQLKPKYNILLRDDKTYPYIVVNLDDDFPRLDITRKIIKGKNVKYFGPFSVGARDLLNSLYLLFPLVQKKACIKGKKACLFFQIKRCLAPCEGKISKDEYRVILDKAINLIHHQKPLIDSLHVKMETYSQSLNFEEAAKLRDSIKNIKQIHLNNQIDLAKLESFDLLGIYMNDGIVCSMRFFIRDGKIVSSSNTINHTKNDFEAESLYRQMLLSFYTIDTPMPINTIYIAHEIEEKDELEELFFDRFGKKIHIKYPKRGEKASLIKLALSNAQELLIRHQKGKSTKIQSAIHNFFELNSFPYSIEVFDNSHLGGKGTVGGIIAWEGDGYNKEKYRHYHLESKDEYSQMRQTLTQRAKRFHKDYPPDLWLIDGGKTLLNLAYEIIQSSGVDVDILAISKEKIDAKSNRSKGKAKDIVHTLKRSYTLSPNDEKLQFLQRLRDEAHRFAINFHRKTKIKEDKESSFLKQKGLTEAKIKKLLSFFGTFDAINKASLEDIQKIIGQKEARKLK